MMLMLLLAEITRLGVKLSLEQGSLKVQAPAGVLADELRQAMHEQRADLLQFAECPYIKTIDGLGMLTGNREERDISFVAPERQARLRYRIGVRLLHDGVERFYYPGMLGEVRTEGIQANDQSGEVSL